MRWGLLSLCCVLCLFFRAGGQELFILNEPASNIPKHTLGVRAFGNTYRELNAQRNMGALRLMYGLTPKLTVMATGTLSNHHDTILPRFLADHTHSGSQTAGATGTVVKGLKYPYLFNGIHLYAKYRFISKDGRNEHFRAAVYAEGSFLKVAHDETEPNLLDDTRGVGAGLITTYLKDRFAVSFTGGVIIPFEYNGYMLNNYYLGPEYNVQTELKYGNAIQYNLSFGYLLLPRHYKDYKQLNLNLYLELQGKSYASAKIRQTDVHGTTDIQISSPLLLANHYVDINPGIQFIVRSDLRIDFSVGLPLINRSYVHYYPLYTFGVQKYFYF